MFRLGRTLRIRCRSLSKVPRAARDVFRTRGTEFYKSGIQLLTQRLQKCVESGEDFAEK